MQGNLSSLRRPDIRGAPEAERSYIFWDFDNILPQRCGMRIVNFFGAVLKFLRERKIVTGENFTTATYLVAGVDYEPSLAVVVSNLSDLGVRVRLSKPKHEQADRDMCDDIQDLIDEKLRGATRSFNIVLLSSDKDFNSIVRRCRKADIPVTVIHDAYAGSQHQALLEQHATRTFGIDEVLRDVPRSPPPTPTRRPGNRDGGARFDAPVASSGLRGADGKPLLVSQNSRGGSVFTEAPRQGAAQQSSKQRDIPQPRSETRNVTDLFARAQSTSVKYVDPVKPSTPQNASIPQPRSSQKRSTSPKVTDLLARAQRPQSASVAESSSGKSRSSGKSVNIGGEMVPATDLVANKAVEYLLQNPQKTGRWCTNKQPHDILQCNFSHRQETQEIPNPRPAAARRPSPPPLRSDVTQRHLPELVLVNNENIPVVTLETNEGLARVLEGKTGSWCGLVRKHDIMNCPFLHKKKHASTVAAGMAVPRDMGSPLFPMSYSSASLDRQDSNFMKITESFSTPVTPNPVKPAKKKKYAAYVCNIDANVSESVLQNFFRSCGEILDVTVQHPSGAAGYAKIDFSAERELQAALKKDGQLLGSRALKVTASMIHRNDVANLQQGRRSAQPDYGWGNHH